jgi:hypothetical protein
MKSALSTLALTVSALLCGAAQAAPVNLLSNGGFEATAVADGTWVNVNSMPGWTWVGGPGRGFEVRAGVEGAAIEGRNFIELDTTGNTSIAQLLSGLNAGGRYDLSFWYSPRIQQSAATNGVDVFWNDAQLGGTITANGGKVNLWSEQRFSVTARGGSDVLRFSSVGTNDSLGGNLDNVRLSASVVPEPASLALVALGLAAAAATRRRKVC